MVTASEIKDEESLRRWLEGRPQTDAVAIAQRASQRALPFFAAAVCADLDQLRKNTLFPILWFSLTSVFAIKDLSLTTPDAEDTGDFGTSFGRTRASLRWAARGAYLTAESLVGRRAAFSRQPVVNPDAVSRATDVSSISGFIALAAEYTDSHASGGATWSAIRADAASVDDGRDCRTLRLWPVETPAAVEQAENALLASCEQEPEDYDFFIRWLVAARDGRPMDWELQKRIALIPFEVDEIPSVHRFAPLIRRIEEEWKAEQQTKATDDLQRALHRTDNAERVEVNPETGLLRLVPTSALPADIAALARINIAAALDLFGPRPQDQYRALDPVRTRLRGVLAQAPDMPLVLFDACRSAVLITQGYVGTQSIPEPDKDPLISDFLRILRETALDIVNNDPRTREVLDQRRAELDAPDLFEARDAILELASQAATKSEGELAIALPEDAETATDPGADPEAQRSSAYRLVGRLLRVAIAIGKGLGWVAGGIAGGEFIISGMIHLAQRPEWQMFLKAAWRFLGLG